MPRIAPLPPESWDDEVKAAMHQGIAVLAEDMQTALRAEDYDALTRLLPNSITTPLRHPRLAGLFVAYNAMLLRNGTLCDRWRELLILRTLWRTLFRYEWLWHVSLAARNGISRSEVDAIVEGPKAGVWTALESDLLSAADELIDHYRIDDATWMRLTEQLDERQLIEVPYVVGTYTCLAMAFNSFEIQADEVLGGVDAPAVPERDTGTGGAKEPRE